MKTDYVVIRAARSGAKTMCETGTGHELVCFYPNNLRQFVETEVLTAQADLLTEIYAAAGGPADVNMAGEMVNKSISKERLINHLSELLARAAEADKNL